MLEARVSAREWPPRADLTTPEHVRATFKCDNLNMGYGTAKRRDLRVRADNPCAGVLPPEEGDSRRRTFVYPVEASSLFACRGVPLPWREAYAVACYLYLRPGELRALTCGDVDLDAQVVHVTKAYDERTRAVKAPKTRNGVRDVPIHPNLTLHLYENRGFRDSSRKTAL